jgi:phenylacetic acid degradation protein
MDNAVIGESSIVAAMAFVKAGMAVPPRTLVAGIPAKVVRELSREEIGWKIEGTVLYQSLAKRSLANMAETVALTEVEADRKRIVLPDIKPLIEARAAWSEAASGG